MSVDAAEGIAAMMGAAHEAAFKAADIEKTAMERLKYCWNLRDYIATAMRTLDSAEADLEQLHKKQEGWNA